MPHESEEAPTKVVVTAESEQYPHQCVYLAVIHSQDQGRADILAPTDEEAAEGRANLEACASQWRATPGLLIIKPELAVIVRVLDHSLDDTGFTLRLQAEETLMAPASTKLNEFDVYCGWNQPYSSFDRDGISAPYSFSLYFGAEGVELARGLHSVLSRASSASETPSSIAPTIFRACFGSDAATRVQEIRAIYENKRD